MTKKFFFSNREGSFISPGIEKKVDGIPTYIRKSYYKDILANILARVQDIEFLGSDEDLNDDLFINDLGLGIYHRCFDFENFYINLCKNLQLNFDNVSQVNLQKITENNASMLNDMLIKMKWYKFMDLVEYGLCNPFSVNSESEASKAH